MSSWIPKQDTKETSKNIFKNIGQFLLMLGTISAFKGKLPPIARKQTIGNLARLLPSKIGQGSEAIVINNSPTTVAKITDIASTEMLKRNKIPNSVPLTFMGYVRNNKDVFPTYLQKKIRILNKDTFPKYLDKLDKAMAAKGFKVVNDPNVQYRAYTNGKVVIDDVSPGNVGINMLGQPKLIDFNLQTIPEWIEQGFMLRKGGKFNFNRF